MTAPRPTPRPVSPAGYAGMSGRTLAFYGASDDLFVCEDSKGKATHEIGCYTDSVGVYEVTVERDGKRVGLLVVGLYNPVGMPKGMPGCWTVGVCPLGEDEPLPSWPCHLTAEGYSTRLIMAVPDHAACLAMSDGQS